MQQKFAILSLSAGVSLSQQDSDGAFDVVKILNKQKEKRVTLCYASNLEHRKIKTIEELFDQTAPSKTLINFGGFGCLNKQPLGSYGCAEITNTIISTEDSVVVLIVDKETRNTGNDPITAFFKNSQFNSKNVLIDVKPSAEKVEPSQAETIPTPVEAQA